MVHINSFDEISGQEWESNKTNVTITWKNVCIRVKTKKKSFVKGNSCWKMLIDNASGAVKDGTMVVLMGPSGAGKSTLMEALAYRNSSGVSVEGEIMVNGEPISNFMHQISGFMHQEDLFVGTLTVREHLRFMVQAKLKLDKSKKRKDIDRIVNNLLTEMGLLNCADTRVGRSGEEKSISGGERKRLAFATEVLTDPAILFCDEPTTGLDSFSALQIVNLMKQMTFRGKTILCTIHQPSSELFAMFEQLILLAEGRIAFAGDPKSALKLFEEQGFVCPPNYNPAEVIIGALSNSSNSKDHVLIKDLCDRFSKSEAKAEDGLVARVVDNKPRSKASLKRITSTFRRESPSWLTKMFWLTHRSFLQVVRDPSVQTVRIFQKLGIALMAGLCFFGTVNLTQSGVQSVQGAIFIMVTENTFPPMYGALSLFPDEFPLLLREYRNGLYPTHLYYISKMISLVPGLILEPVLFVMVAYLVTGLRSTFYAFFMSTLIATLTANVAAACGCFFSSAFGSVSLALAFLVPIDYTLMVTSGLFIKLSSIPNVISWFRYLSWFMYSNEALTIVQWENVTNITCEYSNPEIPCLKTGSEILHKFDFSSSHLTSDIAAMCLMYFIFHVLACLFLCWKTNKNT